MRHRSRRTTAGPPLPLRYPSRPRQVDSSLNFVKPVHVSPLPNDPSRACTATLLCPVYSTPWPAISAAAWHPGLAAVSLRACRQRRDLGLCEPAARQRVKPRHLLAPAYSTVTEQTHTGEPGRDEPPAYRPIGPPAVMLARQMSPSVLPLGLNVDEVETGNPQTSINRSRVRPGTRNSYDGTAGSALTTHGWRGRKVFVVRLAASADRALASPNGHGCEEGWQIIVVAKRNKLHAFRKAWEHKPSPAHGPWQASRCCQFRLTSLNGGQSHRCAHVAPALFPL